MVRIRQKQRGAANKGGGSFYTGIKNTDDYGSDDLNRSIRTKDGRGEMGSGLRTPAAHGTLIVFSEGPMHLPPGAVVAREPVDRSELEIDDVGVPYFNVDTCAEIEHAA